MPADLERRDQKAFFRGLAVLGQLGVVDLDALIAFVQSQAQERVSMPEHLGLPEFKQCPECRRVPVFACRIAHAEQLERVAHTGNAEAGEGRGRNAQERQRPS